MSLLRLLATGKSLMGLQQGAGPYRLTRKRLLPKFPASRNPFRATAKPTLNVEAEPELAGLGQHTRDAAPPPVPEVPTACGPAVPGPSSAFRAKNPARRIWDCWFGRRAENNNSARQVELSLENVKVVRNDLSHYDAEPPVKTTVAASEPKAARVTQPAGSLPGFEVEPRAPFLAGRRP